MNLKGKTFYLVSIAAAFASFFMYEKEDWWLRIGLIVVAFCLIVFPGIKMQRTQTEVGVSNQQMKIINGFRTITGIVAVVLIAIAWLW